MTKVKPNWHLTLLWFQVENFFMRRNRHDIKRKEAIPETTEGIKKKKVHKDLEKELIALLEIPR